MAHVPSGKFVLTTLSLPITLVIPERFRLTFEYESACLAGAGAGHASRLNGLTPTVEFSTRTLLATAALRHFGTSYYGRDPAIAIAKEFVMWSGWLNVRGDGLLRLEHAANSGRLAEVAASLGEAVALDLAISAFGIPLTLWSRIPETGADSMDFRAPGSAGDIAIEAKGGYGSVVAVRKNEILRQKARMTSAAEKYGFVLCYEMSGRTALKRKGSYVKIVDPPGVDSRGTTVQKSVLQHYWQVCVSIGLQWMADYLASLLDVRSKPDTVDRLRDQCRRMLKGHNPRLSVHRQEYLGRYFDLLLLIAPGSDRSGPIRYFFFGIATRVLTLLINNEPEEVLLLTRNGSMSFEDTRQGNFGPVFWTGLADGVLRVDLMSDKQLLDEDLGIGD